MPFAVSANDDVEGIHIESLLAQSVALERRLQEQNLFFYDRDVEAYLGEILDKLVTPDERNLYAPRVRVLRSNAVNAFAAPHGTVFVCTGLLARISNEAQAAAVLAHELTHIVRYHAAKNLIMLKAGARSKQAARQGLALLLGDGVSGSITGAALRASVSGYNRELEREADSVGLLRMTAAGYPHEEFKNLFTMLGDHIATEKIKEPYFFSTHPRLIERVENYRRITASPDFAEGQSVYRHLSEGAVSDDTVVFDVGSIFAPKITGKAETPAVDTEPYGIEEGFFCVKIRSVILYDAFINRAAGRFDLVGAQLDRLLAVDPNDAMALVLRGDMERMLAPRSTAAMEWYERALKSDPKSISAARALGFAYHSIGDKARAEKYLRLYCELANDAAADIKMARAMLKDIEQGSAK